MSKPSVRNKQCALTSPDFIFSYRHNEYFPKKQYCTLYKLSQTHKNYKKYLNMASNSIFILFTSVTIGTKSTSMSNYSGTGLNKNQYLCSLHKLKVNLNKEIFSL
jgi:hypothetical protein